MTWKLFKYTEKKWYDEVIEFVYMGTLFLFKSMMKELWQLRELWLCPLKELDEKEPSLKYKEKSNAQSCPLTLYEIRR